MATMMGAKLLLALCLSLSCVQQTQAQHVHRRSDDANVLEAAMQQQASTIQTLQAQLTALQNDVNALKQKTIAFTVRFSTENPSIANQGVFRFDMVPMNLGDGYNSHSGLFTAPYSGTYVFLLSIMVKNDQGGLHVGITASGRLIAEAHADSSAGVWNKGTAHVTVHMNAGDEAWVSHIDGTTSIHGGWWTVFSGFLLHAD